MFSLLPLSFAAGVLTVAAPCLLPVLPAILGGSLGTSKWRPLGIVAGLVVTFTIFGTAFAIFLDVLGISKGTLRVASIVLLFLFGVALAVPALWEWMVVRGTFVWRKISARGSCCNPPPSSSPTRGEETIENFPPIRGGKQSHISPPPVGGARGGGNGFWGGFGIGSTLGVVWTPCAGPILGAILTFAANTQNVFQSGLLFFTYGLGAAVPMLLIGYGGRALTLRIKGFARASARIRQVGGIILVIWAIALWLGVDRYFQANLNQFLPQPRL
ncbi:cytochrome c biogenesis protein CcdA [Candidatus Uhrbacteria bacterium]|nr:cytochrome c biogenesis protein CcdA [Candidatus Uhrbacteria bacterium]